MSKAKKLISRSGCLLLAGIMSAGLLSGCSGSGSDSETQSAASSGSGESTTVTTVKVGTFNAMPPYCYLDDDGNLTGYDVEVLRAIDERLPEYSFDIEGMDFEAMLIALESKTLDIASCQFVPTEERREKFLFPENYYCLSPLVLAVRADSGITSLDDMAGKKILTNPSSYEYTMLVNYNDQHPDKQIELYNVTDITTADMYKMVANGQVDGNLSYIGTFDELNSSLGLNLVRTDVVMVEDTYFMLNSDDQVLCDAIDGVLAEMQSDGTLSELSTKYLGEDVFGEYSSLVSTSESN